MTHHMNRIWMVLSLTALVSTAAACTAVGSEKEPSAPPIIQTSQGDTGIQTTSASSEMERIDIDLDGDGVTETAKLVFDGGLTLAVGEANATLTSVFSSDATLPPHIETGITGLSGDGGSLSLLVSIVWPTNKIGSTVELWLYEYTNGKLSLRWRLEDEQPDVQSTKADSKTLVVRIPAYVLKQNLRLPETDISRLQKVHSSEDPLAQPDLIGMWTPTAFAAGDLDSDGHDELVVNRLLCLESPPFYAGRLFTVFRLKEGQPLPSRSFVAVGDEAQVLDLLMTDKSGLPASEKDLPASLQGRINFPLDRAVSLLKSMVRQGFLQVKHGRYRFK